MLLDGRGEEEEEEEEEGGSTLGHPHGRGSNPSIPIPVVVE